jgi:hypothetical protein
MYPFNYIQNQQNKICFEDYGFYSGKWCGAKRGAASESGYFDSGVLLKSGNGLSRKFNQIELSEFTIEYWGKTEDSGTIFKTDIFEFGLERISSNINNFYTFGSGRVTGIDNETGQWNHYGLSVSGVEFYSGGDYIQDRGRLGVNLTGNIGFQNGVFNKALSGTVSGSILDFSNPTYTTTQFWINPGHLTGDNLIFYGLHDVQCRYRPADIGVEIYLTGDPNPTPGLTVFSSLGLIYGFGWTNISYTIGGNLAGKLITGYIDGVLSQTGQIILGNFPDIMIRASGGDLIDELLFYSGALSSGEIFSGLNETKDNPESDNRLLHYYKFDGLGNSSYNKNHSFYKNGILQLTGISTGTKNSLTFERSYIGQRMTGSFDEFRIWSGARSSGDIYKYYNQQMLNYLGFTNSGLISYVPFSKDIECSQHIFSGGDVTGIFDYPLLFGTQTGYFELNYDTMSLADKFELYWDNVKQFDTDYVFGAGITGFNKTKKFPLTGNLRVTSLSTIGSIDWSGSMDCPV